MPREVATALWEEAAIALSILQSRPPDPDLASPEALEFAERSLRFLASGGDARTLSDARLKVDNTVTRHASAVQNAWHEGASSMDVAFERAAEVTGADVREVRRSWAQHEQRRGARTVPPWEPLPGRTPSRNSARKKREG